MDHEIVKNALIRALASGDERPVSSVFRHFFDDRILGDGFVVLPLHQFQFFPGVGLNTPEYFVFNGIDACIIQQSSEIKTIARRLSNAVRHWDMKGTLPIERLLHFHSTRNLDWLVRNPLLILKWNGFKNRGHTAKHGIVCKLKHASFSTSMMSALQNGGCNYNGAQRASSSKANQTSDMNHYLSFGAPERESGSFEGKCTPINIQPLIFSEISNICFDINTYFWESNEALMDRLFSAANLVYREYLKNSFFGKESRKANFYRKMFESASFFRRSFQQTLSSWSEIINLSIALEMLLTESYSRGVADRLKDRAKILSKETGRGPYFGDSVRDLYNARNAMMHTGLVPKNVDLQTARKAFVFSFLAIAESVSKIDIDDGEIMNQILSIHSQP